MSNLFTKHCSATLILCISLQSLQAQENEWNSGALVLSDNQVLVGELQYHHQHDMVILKIDNKMKTFPAFKINEFRFYDANDDINRRFRALDVKNAKGANLKVIYEVVLHGSLSLLRKEKKHKSKCERSNLRREIEDYVYYSYDEERLVEMRNFKKRVLPLLMQERGPQLTKFIEEHKLNLDKPATYVKILDYYNDLQLIVQN
ncbi:hypothetical protein QQ008_26420 [Fulvivirgaceae bacterium BMA10]|uniref:DUF4369 domain-containing protein n=1 Tax=Splendidivirga corallicola TaxID=3051826 RepID=A0ABT8KXS8_9BACT|nr:hypothetical protein [Fulvivirgaceae bacterium BMA10]